MNIKKVTWCENWLKKTFEKYPSIECNLLFEMANKAGLYEKSTCNSELSTALSILDIKTNIVKNYNGEFLYRTFCMPY